MSCAGVSQGVVSPDSPFSVRQAKRLRLKEVFPANCSSLRLPYGTEKVSQEKRPLTHFDSILDNNDLRPGIVDLLCHRFIDRPVCDQARKVTHLCKGVQRYLVEFLAVCKQN